MDIMNKLSEERYNEVDDLLTFISIYDDEERTKSYIDMVKRHKEFIIDKTVMEAGSGFGIVSKEMAKLKAKKVYSIEVNPSMFKIASENLKKLNNINLINTDIKDFYTDEENDLLVHEFFGQMLYDEELYLLDKLKFKPKQVLPNKARLVYGWEKSSNLCDDVVTPYVLKQLEGVLVMGLFDDEELKFQRAALEWTYEKGLKPVQMDLSDIDKSYDIIYFGIEIFDGNIIVGKTGHSSNWSYIFSPRVLDKFEISFDHNGRFMETVFKWCF